MATKRRYTTRAEDMAFLQARLADLHRAWAPGDACAGFGTTEPTTLVRIDGDTAYLANGQACHVSRMRRPF